MVFECVPGSLTGARRLVFGPPKVRRRLLPSRQNALAAEFMEGMARPPWLTEAGQWPAHSADGPPASRRLSSSVGRRLLPSRFPFFRSCPTARREPSPYLPKRSPCRDVPHSVDVMRLLLLLLGAVLAVAQQPYTPPRFEDPDRLDRIQSVLPQLDELYRLHAAAAAAMAAAGAGI